jgi:hypothetical protein
MTTEIVGYKDSKGCEAEVRDRSLCSPRGAALNHPHQSQPGTYDELASLDLSIIPRPGSSGGPLVDPEHGAVTGLIRGSRLSHNDRRTLGKSPYCPAGTVFFSSLKPSR